jgi:hypothetical protein
MRAELPRDPAGSEPGAVRYKPTVAQLGVNLAAQDWQRSGTGDGSFEIAFVRASVAEGAQASVAEGAQASVADGAGTSPSAAAPTDRGVSAGAAADWVLLRVAGDPAGRVLVYDRNEWECFLDGVGRGEFDDEP